MNSILTNNNKFFKTIIDKSDYWDFKIANDRFGATAYEGLQVDCLSAFIDTNFEDCVDETNNMIFSMNNSKYIWDKAINKGVSIENVGFTGVDNCAWAVYGDDTSKRRLEYDKNTIENEEFLDLYTNSKLTFEEGDVRLKLISINGNNKIYNYPNIEYETYTNNGNDINVAKFNGNFFQGTFRYGDGCDYNVLPSTIENGWCLEFTLMRKDFEEHPVNTLNDTHPNNNGIFFYIGTRAENKWWKYYKTEINFPKTNYTQPCEGAHNPENEELDIETTSGINIKDANIAKIESDNGFLLFDRTKDGVTSKTYEEGMKVVIEQRKNVEEPNFFQYVNRTKDGFTAKNISQLEKCYAQKYDVLSDLYENALAFYISESGSVGYKYYVNDCDGVIDNNVITEFSNDGIIKKEKWYVIDVRFVTKPLLVNSKTCTEKNYKKSMRLMFYVNGVLVFVSKELPLLNLRQLNDVDEKQVGVPYNISIGGGTQGLCDVVYSDYKMLPEYILPLEENFCGSFIGYFKSFKFYDCDKNYEQINKNVIYEMKDLDLDYCWDSFGNISKDTATENDDNYYLETLFGNQVTK